MLYVLKQYDKDLIYFSMEQTMTSIKIEIQSINEEYKHLLPLDLSVDNKSLLQWLYKRIIPRNRAYASNFLSKMGLNEKDVIGIINISQGLSLNDSY